ncbi:MAG: D-alanyl-D-alanine carboxypeptidase family protein [Lachnospiraceae bacterium]|nr:D-alanyl-D-alanine carboxypeptidase family protein [Lachnospiraceae bacterium]
MFFYLIYINIVKLIKGNRRKLFAVLCGLSLFVIVVSFSPRGEPKGVVAVQANSDSVYYYTDSGIVEVDELSEDDLSNASIDDMERLMDDLSNTSGENINTEYTSESDVVLCDADGSMKKPDFDDDWSLILINKQHKIPSDYQVELGTIKGAIKADTRVLKHVHAMIKAADDDGVKLYICSPFRDSKRQQMLFERKIKSYEKQGISYNEAYDLASQTVAIPGTSEHEVGLAFDFITENYTTLDAGFEETDAGKWLKENAADYGFILRYPLGKEDITQIEYEPWHYRYVGKAAATEIMSRNITLEEYDRELGIVDD